MKDLMMNEDFSDLTLVTEDKKHMKANSSILSTCSPVFKDILKTERTSRQIIYLRGVQQSELESIMQFIYLGEAECCKERLDEFLAVAKSLEIKELCNAETQPIEELVDELSSFDPVMSTEGFKEETVILKQMKMEAPQERQRNEVSVIGPFECDQCQKTYSRKAGLYTHKQTVHLGVRYACDHCDYQATQKTDLTKHIQSKHKGVRYACDQCDYQATRQDHLKDHIKVKHEGVRDTFACDQCNYKSSWKHMLNSHKRATH